MTKRRIMKLFAVTVALAGNGCDSGPTATPPAPALPKVFTAQPVVAPADAAPAPVQPVRTLRNGRPACGNVNSKAPRPKDCV